MYTIKTDNPIATDSPDHLHPKGTLKNFTCKGFIEDMAAYHGGSAYSMLDLGCAGAQLVVDAIAAGNVAVGIDGSDACIKAGSVNWQSLGGESLFTADITQPFAIEKKGNTARFDIVTAWEVLEHIPESQLQSVILNVLKHLRPGGLFVGSVSTVEDSQDGVALHQTVKDKAWWEGWLSQWFEPVKPSPVKHWMNKRARVSSVWFCMRRKEPVYTVQTEYPVALDSPDHLHPKGTARDNNTWPGFIDDVEAHFQRPVSFLDLGCAGGQFIVDFLTRGHEAVGLEGSDYSLKAGRANWPRYGNSRLLTCDISHPFDLTADGEPALFDVITAVEVLEHIPEDRLTALFCNIAKHIKAGGIFVASIGTRGDTFEGADLHQTIKPATWWLEQLAEWFTPLDPCPVTNWPRHKHPHSLSVCMRRI